VTPVPYVAFVPFAPSALPLTNPSSPISVNLIAVSANDATNQGLDWSVCADPPTCGEFLKTPGAPATASSAAVPPVYSSTLHAASGQAVSYLPPSVAPANGTVTINVASTAYPAAGTAQAIAISSNGSFTGVALQGTVMAGSLPVYGASVQLYEAGNGGYGSAASPLTFSNGANSVTTGKDGSFSIPAGYACTFLTNSGSSQFGLLYLVATGGAPNGQSSPNGQLGLMAALGPCSNLNSSVSLVVNEISTVATAWALAPFTGTGGGSFQNYEFIGSSSGNYNNGLANAFAAVNNLVNITTGQALEFTPGGGLFKPAGGLQVANGVVPYAEINTLADAIDTCAATSGGAPGDGSACDAFFYASNVNPVGGNGTHSNEPASILPAVLEIAQYPARNSSPGPGNPFSGSEIYNLVSAPVNPGWTPPFTPTLVSNGAGVPTDWTIALSYTGGGLEGAKRAKAGSTAMAIDGAGNLWIANSDISSVTELSNLGVALSPYASGSTMATAGGFKGGGLSFPAQIAIDFNGNAWVLNNNSTLSELDSTGTPVICGGSTPDPFCGGSTLSSPFSGAGNPANTAVGLAVDGNGRVWVADSNTSGTGGDVAEYAGFSGAQVNGKQVSNGMALSPSGVGYTNLTSSNDPNDTQPANPSQAISVDGKGNVWDLDQANDSATELSSSGSYERADHGYQQIDPSTGKPISPCLTSTQFGNTMAVDSAGDIFIPDGTNGSQIYELFAPGSASDPNSVGTGQVVDQGAIDPGIFPPIAIDGSNHLWLMTQAGLFGNIQEPAAVAEFSASGTLLNGNSGRFGYVGPGTVNVPESIAVDASGNIWLLFGGASAPVVEFVGVATPVVTPMSLGKPGAKP
jgi:hypothetical protein